MYCKHCGKQNDDSAKFCFSCGSPISYVRFTKETLASSTAYKSSEYPFQNVTAKPNMPHIIQRLLKYLKKARLAKVGLVVSVAVVLLALLVIFIVTPTIEHNESRKALQDFAQAQLNCDTKTLSTYICPDLYQKELEAALKDGKNEDDFRENLESNNRRNFPGFTTWTGSEFKSVGYSIKDSHRASSSELKELNTWLKNEKGFKNKATSAIIYEVSVDYTSIGGYSDSSTNFLMCLRFKGDWYIISDVAYWRCVQQFQTLGEVKWVTNWVYSHY